MSKVSKQRRRIAREARRAIRRGETPTYRVLLDRRRVVDMPWLEFDGGRPAEIAEAARRSIAADLRLRPELVQVDPMTGS
jgi:hypothetical protein